jgi:hypothetical protein
MVCSESAEVLLEVVMESLTEREWEVRQAIALQAAWMFKRLAALDS